MTLQVLAGTGKSTSSKASGGYFAITAKSDAGTGAAIADTTTPFKFVADLTGKPTLEVKSAPSDARILSSSSEAESLEQKVALRSTMNLMFCPKPIADCVDADWVVETCAAPDCKITGSTVEHSTQKFGTYVLHGTSGYVVEGGGSGGSEGGSGGSGGTSGTSNSSETSSSAASTLSVALSLVVAAIVHLCI
jgi:hypothetical protein